MSTYDARTFEEVREEIVEQVETLRLLLDHAAEWAAHHETSELRFEAEAWIVAVAMIARGDIVAAVRQLPTRFAQHHEQRVLDALEREL